MCVWTTAGCCPSAAPIFQRWVQCVAKIDRTDSDHQAIYDELQAIVKEARGVLQQDTLYQACKVMERVILNDYARRLFCWVGGGE